MDWEFMEQQSRIVDIKHARRFPSEKKCKINDADERVMKKLRVNKLSINKQPGVCVKSSLCTSNVEARMFNEKNVGASQVKRKASSKRNASGFPSSYFLRTSPDVVTQFFFPFKDCGKVASRKKLALTEQDILGMKVSNFLYNLRRSRRPAFFFSCVKIKSVRETFFGPFFEFFHGQKIAFTHTFLQVFTYSQNFSRALLMIFSRMDFVFSREGYRYFLKFSRMGFFFSRVKN